jgi:molybdenum cofactor sulfurtransferase
MDGIRQSAETLTRYAPEMMSAAYQDFLSLHPGYGAGSRLDDLREREYGRLDRTGQIYLDYTGGGLYAERQIDEHMQLLKDNVLGNPHSHNPTSMAMTALVEQARDYVLEYFNADPDEYVAIFTPNASGALKLLGESYPFAPGGHYLYCADNHNSVNGIREFARAKGAAITSVPLLQSEMRLDEATLERLLTSRMPGHYSLFAYPAQSNFTGVQHPLEWVSRAQAGGWHVLLDAAAFVPTNRLDLGSVHPDFVSLSFYKIFGYPTGVGALIARRDALATLRRPWFAGGTITIASILGDGHFLVDGSAAFEDGTVNYLGLPAIEIGLQYIATVGIDAIHDRVTALVGWLLDEMAALRHSNGMPMVRVHGPTNTQRRGGTIAFNLLDPSGQPVNGRRIEELATHANISLRTGCFCNPGAGETAHGLLQEEMRPAFEAGIALSFDQFRDVALERYGKEISTTRISVGIASTFADAFRFMTFFAGLRDRDASSFRSSMDRRELELARRDSA